MIDTRSAWRNQGRMNVQFVFTSFNGFFAITNSTSVSSGPGVHCDLILHQL